MVEVVVNLTWADVLSEPFKPFAEFCTFLLGNVELPLYDVGINVAPVVIVSVLIFTLMQM